MICSDQVFYSYGHLPCDIFRHWSINGWLSNIRGKPLLYGLVADTVREQVCRVRSSETATQLASIEASTLRAPEGLHDDRADAFALAIAAVAWQPPGEASTVVEAEDPLAEYDRRGW